MYFSHLVHADLLLQVNGGVPDDVGSHQTSGFLRPPHDEIQHLVVFVQITHSLRRGNTEGEGIHHYMLEL